MEAIVKYLESLPREMLLVVVHQLMTDNAISYHELMDMHISHLKELEKGQSEAYFRLQAHVMTMWCDHKKNMRKNLRDTVQLLKNEGRVNVNQEKLDNYKID